MLAIIILVLVGILSYILFCGDNRDIIDEINKKARYLVKISSSNLQKINYDIKKRQDMNKKLDEAILQATILAKKVSSEGKDISLLLYKQ
jgi:hypothetical protein